MLTLLLGVALAEPAEAADAEPDADLSFGRRGQRAEPHWYARLDDLGGPVAPRWSRRTPSTYRVWEFPDGVVERSWQRERGEVIEERFFDLLGWPTETLRFEEEVPTEGVVHLAEPVELPLTGYEPHALEGARLFTPSEPVDGAFELAGGRFRVWTSSPGVDVQDPSYPDGWLRDCGCILVERQPAWVDGEPGVRLRFHTLALGAPDVAYLWAVPRPEATWLASYRVQHSERPDADLAPGRLVLRTARWLPPAEDGSP
jgi:hypothetical protein